jgi:hypothetical protein
VHERKPSRASKRHHYDYAFPHFGQRSVESTAAAKDNSLVMASATAEASSIGREMQSVGRPMQVFRKKHWPAEEFQKRWVVD